MLPRVSTTEPGPRWTGSPGLAWRHYRGSGHRVGVDLAFKAEAVDCRQELALAHFC